MNACQSMKRAGDCLARNARTLCDYCESLLSRDEHMAREVAFYVARARAKAERVYQQRKPRKCIALNKDTEAATCLDKKLTNICAFCITSLTEKQLTKYANALAQRGEESRKHWAEHAESDVYLAELRAAGVRGIEWNIEQVDESNFAERNLIIFSLFLFSAPCHVRPLLEVAA